MQQPEYSISQSDLRKLLAAANADAALLYLYLLAQNPLQEAMQSLGMQPQQFDLACAALRQLGLWTQDDVRHIRLDQPPVYTEEDLANEYTDQSEFSSVVGEAQRRLGRILSTEELKILLSLYRYLGLEPEVISILINYCIQRARGRGNVRMPSLRSIEKEAYHWADNGIDTMEEAAVFVQSQLQMQSRIGKIQHVLSLDDRRLTAGEQKLIRTWLDWGFGEAEIRLAYEKTCMNTGGLKWPYLNSILKSWHEQGLTRLQEIETGDRMNTANKTSARPGYRVHQHGDAPTDFEKQAIEKMLKKGLYEEA